MLRVLVIGFSTVAVVLTLAAHVPAVAKGGGGGGGGSYAAPSRVVTTSVRPGVAARPGARTRCRHETGAAQAPRSHDGRPAHQLEQQLRALRPIGGRL